MFAIEVIKLVRDLPPSKVSDVIRYQILKSATSVGANYRAACRSRSKKEFLSKINIVEEEADETVYWLEIIHMSDLIQEDDMKELLQEAGKLTALFTSIGKSTKQALN